MVLKTHQGSRLPAIDGKVGWILGTARDPRGDEAIHQISDEDKIQPLHGGHYGLRFVRKPRSSGPEVANSHLEDTRSIVPTTGFGSFGSRRCSIGTRESFKDAFSFLTRRGDAHRRRCCSRMNLNLSRGSDRLKFVREDIRQYSLLMFPCCPCQFNESFGSDTLTYQDDFLDLFSNDIKTVCRFDFSFELIPVLLFMQVISSINIQATEADQSSYIPSMNHVELQHSSQKYRK